MPITLRRKQLRGLLSGVGLLAGILLSACQPSGDQTTPSLTVATAVLTLAPTRAAGAAQDAPDQTAVRILRAFYAADYRDRDQWLATLKPLASADGYSLLENMIAPALWQDLAEAQTIVTAEQISVEDGGLIAEGVSQLVDSTPWQIRQATITLTSGAKWPGWKSASYATNILLSHEPDGWKFVMLLSDDQAEVFKTQPKGDR